MELRVLRYFLAVANEGTVTDAAKVLHITQPNLSKQLAELEREVGCTLFIRGSRKITLTEEGRLLQRKARAIVDSADETLDILKHFDESLSGNISFALGEGESIRPVMRTIGTFASEHPLVSFHITSGDSHIVMDLLDRGEVDFGVLIGPVEIRKYESLTLPDKNVWGILARKDSALAELESISPQDLATTPLTCSRQVVRSPWFASWLGYRPEKLQIATTFNLINNAALLIEEAGGCALSIEGILDRNVRGDLMFKRLSPLLTSETYLVWRKNNDLSPAARRFLALLKEEIGIASELPN